MIIRLALYVCACLILSEELSSSLERVPHHGNAHVVAQQSLFRSFFASLPLLLLSAYVAFFISFVDAEAFQFLLLGLSDNARASD